MNDKEAMSKHENRDSDHIVNIRTFRWEYEPRLLWVEITTKQGLVGLGETYYNSGAVESVIHEMIAPLLIGQSPFDIEHYWITLFSCINFYGYGGAEMRALSAVDIALWDILGQETGKPIYSLLGGKVRHAIPIYNTCVNGKLFQDKDAFLARPGELAEELLEKGIGAMKIFPWDQFAPKIRLNNGSVAVSMGPPGALLNLEQLKAGLAIVENIRKTVGNKMEIMIEGHSSWDLNSSLKIARALEPLDIFWMEDMMQPNNPDDLARLVSESRVPQAVSERLLTRYSLRQVLEKKAAHIVMMDVVWTGGITEAKKVAALADTYHLPVAPHDCVGPVNVFASMHICASASNAMIMETSRAFYDGGYYGEVVTHNLPINRNMLEFSDAPGLGTALLPEFKQRKDVTSRVSKA